MRLQVGALAMAFAVVWSVVVLVAGFAHLIWAPYGDAFWQLVVAIYPGVRAVGMGSVLLATLYAVIDGGICGAIIGWVYNAAVARTPVA
jgi:hypothetical protein